MSVGGCFERRTSVRRCRIDGATAVATVCTRPLEMRCAIVVSVRLGVGCYRAAVATMVECKWLIASHSSNGGRRKDWSMCDRSHRSCWRSYAYATAVVLRVKVAVRV